MAAINVCRAYSKNAPIKNARFKNSSYPRQEHRAHGALLQGLTGGCAVKQLQ